MDFVDLAPYTAVCGTPECENEGIPLEVTAAAEGPYVLCGACGQVITDLAGTSQN